MRTQVLRRSWIDEIGRYRSTRLPGRLYIPIALFLATAGLTNHRSPSVLSWCLTWLCAYLFIFQLRVWDDLADLEEDCQREPGRVLCCADSLTPFYWFSLVLGIMILVVLVGGNGAPMTVIAYLIICALAGTWYRFHRTIGWSNLACAHIVLLKYPLFVLLIGAPYASKSLTHMIIAVIVVYETYIFYEIAHDTRYRNDPIAFDLLVLHALLLVGIWLIVAFEMRYGAALAQSLNALAMVPGIWFLGASLLTTRHHRAPPLGGVPIFITSFACCLALITTSYSLP